MAQFDGFWFCVIFHFWGFLHAFKIEFETHGKELSAFTGAWSKQDIGDWSPFDPVFYLELDVDSKVLYAIYELSRDAEHIGKINDDGSKNIICFLPNCSGIVYTNPEDSYVSETFLHGSAVITKGNLLDIYHVKETGFYSLVISSASPGENVKGRFIIKNPYGFLPYILYPLHRYFIAFAIFYGLFIALWLGICLWIGWKNVLSVQKYILGVAGIYMTDLFFRYKSLSVYNDSDVASSVYTVIVIVMQGLGSTLSLFLLLLVSLGYGIAQSNVGIEKSRLFCLGYCHFAFSVITGASSFYLDARESRTLIFMSSIPLAFTYSVFFLWIMTALKDTKERLMLSNQTVKLAMYENMTRSMFSFFITTAVIVILMSVTIYVKTGSIDWYQRHWGQIWFLKEGWPVPLFATSFLILAWIWRPRHDNRSYMLQQIGSHDDDPFSYELNVGFDGKDDADFSRSRNTVIFENKSVSRRPSPTRPKGADADEYEELMEQDLNAVDK